MPGSREEDFQRNNAFSLYDLYGHAPAKNPCPGVMKFTILVDPSLVIITGTLVKYQYLQVWGISTKLRDIQSLDFNYLTFPIWSFVLYHSYYTNFCSTKH